jgi:signal transduction histidine kinase
MSNLIGGNLRRAYIIALGMIAILTIVSQILIQITLGAGASDAVVINLSGRQRMLSQRISKTALAIDYLPAESRVVYLNELETALSNWRKAHNGLQRGDIDLRLPAPTLSVEVSELFGQIDPYFQAMQTAAGCVLTLNGREGQTNAPCDQTQESYIETVLANEGNFLLLMDRITFQFDSEATTRVNQLRVIEVGLMVVTLLVLLLEALFIFRPTQKRLETAQKQLENANADLERRVQERTVSLARANEDLQAANAEVRSYAHAVSHDLRSPIASIQGFVSELRLDLDRIKPALATNTDPDVREALDMTIPESLDALQNSSNRMDRLTRGMLQVARDGQRVMSPEVLAMNTVFQTVLDQFALDIQKYQVQVICQDLPPAYADSVMVEQIISNLLSNAIKYLDPTRAGVIQINGRTENGKVIYSVQDNGRGIAKNEYERVFQLFRRAGAQDTEGEGIGLYYARALARRHNGDIWFDSQPNQGSTFHFSLPTPNPKT